MVAVSVKGIVLFAGLMVMSSLGMVFLCPAVLLLTLPVSLSLFRKINDLILQVFFKFMTGIVEVLFGVGVKISGDLKKVKGPCLIVLNHRTRFDWLFLWTFLARQGSLAVLKIILKDSLKKIPGFGWGLQTAQYIFLSRKWAQDKDTLTRNLAYFSSIDYPLQLLLFPEGTDLSPSNKLKSQQYAEKHDLPKYEFVLNPRTTGFVHCMKEMRKAKTPPCILDLSVAYLGEIPQNESDILAGRWPREIHYHSTLVPASELPESDQDLDQWLFQRWDAKEKQLRYFYEHSKFDATYMNQREVDKCRGDLVTALAFWTLLNVWIIYCVYSSTFYLLYFLVCGAVYLLIDFLMGGVNNMVLQRHSFRHK